MSQTDRRKKLYEKIHSARQADPQRFIRQAESPEAIARQAYHSSLIEGCKVSYEQLYSAAEQLVKSRE